MKNGKGIATIIATIILVVITIGLISTAYIYFTSIVTVGPVVSSMTMPRCQWDETSHTYNVTIYLKNEGTDKWDSIDWLWDGKDLGTGMLVDDGCNSVEAGKQKSCMFVNVTNYDFEGTHTFTAIGPRNQVAIPVTC